MSRIQISKQVPVFVLGLKIILNQLIIIENKKLRYPLLLELFIQQKTLLVLMPKDCLPRYWAISCSSDMSFWPAESRNSSSGASSPSGSSGRPAHQRDHGVYSSVAEPPLFWAAPAPGRQGPGADSGSGSRQKKAAPGGSGSIHKNFSF